LSKVRRASRSRRGNAHCPFGENGKKRNDAAEDGEKEIFTIRPTLMFVKIGYGLAVLGGLFSSLC
jgi:hypothetical protein